MKRIAYFVSVLAVASVVSCQKQEIVDVETRNEVVSEKTSFTCVIPETKTTLGAGDVVYWASSDLIDVYGVKESTVYKAVYNLTDGSGTKTAKFTLKDGEDALPGDCTSYYAVYPSGITFSSASFKTDMCQPSAALSFTNQAIVEGGYDPSKAIMIAHIYDGNLVFAHGAAYFGIQIPDDNITKVEISFGNNALQTKPTYTPSTGVISATSSGSGTISTTSGSFVKGSYYYLIGVPKKPADAAKFKSISITYYVDGVARTPVTSSSATIKDVVPAAGHIYDFGCPPLPAVVPAISADNVEIGASDDDGSVTFSVSNPAGDGVMTAEVTSATPADWLSLGSVTTSVPFTCAANETKTGKTATVRLTYTYDTDKTITKDVTVTQRGVSISHTAISNIPAAGGDFEDGDAYTVTFTDAEGWTPSVTSDGVIVTSPVLSSTSAISSSPDARTISYTVEVNDSDPRNGSITVTLTKGLVELSETITVSQLGTGGGASPETFTWNFTTDEANFSYKTDDIYKYSSGSASVASTQTESEVLYLVSTSSKEIKTGSKTSSFDSIKYYYVTYGGAVNYMFFNTSHTGTLYVKATLNKGASETGNCKLGVRIDDVLCGTDVDLTNYDTSKAELDMAEYSWTITNVSGDPQKIAIIKPSGSNAPWIFEIRFVTD